MNVLRIAGGRIVDPSQGIDRVLDLWIADGRVAAMGEAPRTNGSRLVIERSIDASGLLVAPGLVDMHVHLREPGDEAAETIATGTRAALESGFTSVACMPDTEPAIDSQASAEFVMLQASRAANVNVFPVGAVTKRRAGEELAEMGGLVDGGAVAFTDSGRPIQNADIMRRALEYSQMFARPVLSHPEVPELTVGGIMHEGLVSVGLGMRGMPAAAEEIMVDRDLRLAAWTGGKLHLQNLSSAGSVESLRRARSAGVRVTAEVCPHHLLLHDRELRSFDSNYKVNPPLRRPTDAAALLEGLADGTIDVLASGHAPIAPEQKLRELDEAPFGVIGIETLLPTAIRALIEPGIFTWPQLIARLATHPAKILGIRRGTLKLGSAADVALIDPDEKWTIDPEKFCSKSRNCPFAGWEVRGRAQATVVAGQVRFLRDPSRVTTPG